MIITLERFVDTGKCTLGSLSIDGEGQCYTLEDVAQPHKIQGETRIPAGEYEIKLRNVGGMTQTYAKKFGLMHRGMLWLQDVPDFEWVYIHYGNYAKNTDGCILVGSSADIERSMIGSSVDTYKEIYPKIASAIEDGEKVTIIVV